MDRVTKRAWAISEFVSPDIAISATPRSLDVSESTPLKRCRCGRPPAATSCSWARRWSAVAPHAAAAFDPLAQDVARLGPAAGLRERGAEVDEGPRVIEPRG
ncbi:MAG TPA: hypothetical protein VK631_14075 [Solirubrobacteraceae bacterium]|nr:hypothetical protein [Solirubrobacteraceae bacterium]